MDTQNRFHTDSTFRLVRAEAVLALAALSYFLVAFFSDVNWSRFLCAFVAIDLIGYLPGAIAHRRAAAAARPRQAGRSLLTEHVQPVRIPALYHHLYNLTHSFLTVAVILALWLAWAGDVEWAMLALPIHLLADRGLFANTYKPPTLPFEPAPCQG